MDRERIHQSITANVRMSFSRSSGPGGQNCNKVNTKVFATIDIETIEGFTENERNLLKQRLQRVLHNTSEFSIAVQDERYQGINRQIALTRLEERILQAARTHAVRHKTKPTAGSRERRLKSKKVRSVLKKDRSSTSAFEK